MNTETVGNGIVAILIIGSRIISHFEHKKTEKGVNKNDATLNEIHIMINSRMDKMLTDAKEQGRQEVLSEKNK